MTYLHLILLNMDLVMSMKLHVIISDLLRTGGALNILVSTHVSILKSSVKRGLHKMHEGEMKGVPIPTFI